VTEKPSNFPHVEASDIRHWNLYQVATSQFFVASY